MWTEQVAVVLPGRQVEMLRARVAAGDARSVSAQVAAAVAEHLREPGGPATGSRAELPRVRGS